MRPLARGVLRFNDERTVAPSTADGCGRGQGEVRRRCHGVTAGGQHRCGSAVNQKRGQAMRTILLIVVIILLLGALPTWPYSAGWGYYPSGGLGLVLLILIILAVMGRI
jgi:hypothetical protein